MSDMSQSPKFLREQIFSTSDLKHLEQKLVSGADQLHLDLDSQKRYALLDYLALFHKWNKTYNLSAVRKLEDMLVKHLFDSLSVVAEIAIYTGKNPNHTRFIDVGTGGGLPGIPLAIVLPELTVHLLDSAGKKTRFLFHVKQSLALRNIEIHNMRVENYQPEYLFHGVLSRAFASLEDMLNWCDHLLDSKGLFWAMKGVFPQDELRQIEKHYKVDDHKKLTVPGLEGERCLIRLSKQNSN